MLWKDLPADVKMVIVHCLSLPDMGNFATVSLRNSMLVGPVLEKILMQRSVKLVRELSRRRANYEQTREMFNLQLHPATFDNKRTHRQAYYSGRVLGSIIENQIYDSVMASRIICGQPTDVFNTNAPVFDTYSLVSSYMRAGTQIRMRLDTNVAQAVGTEELNRMLDDAKEVGERIATAEQNSNGEWPTQYNG
jgi:hypothetical protein